MPKVTVIMPSLNVVKYIRSCLESVLAQTLQDIEILIIDAGSDDGTLEILQDYAVRDERVNILHSDRKSYGYQLNMGIALAQGDYIGIVETDDKIFPDMYETLYHTAIDAEAEYVKGRAIQFLDFKAGAEWNNIIGTPLIDKSMLGKLIAPCDMPELLLRDIYLWNGIYKKEFVSNILLNETPGAAFQDQGFLFLSITSSKRAVYLDKVVCQYRQDNANSSIFNQKGFHYLVEEYEYIEKFLINLNEEWRNVYYQRMWNQTLGPFRTMAASGIFWEEAEPDMEILRGKFGDAVNRRLLKTAEMDEERRALLELFLKGISDICSHCINEFKGKLMAVDHLMKLAENRQIIIFGSGRNGKFLHALIENRRSGLVAAYCDNNSNLWETKIQGVSVLSPNESVRRYENVIYAITNVQSADIMKQQLENLGVADENIEVYREGVSLLLFHRS